MTCGITIAQIISLLGILLTVIIGFLMYSLNKNSTNLQRMTIAGNTFRLIEKSVLTMSNKIGKIMDKQPGQWTKEDILMYHEWRNQSDKMLQTMDRFTLLIEEVNNHLKN